MNTFFAAFAGFMWGPWLLVLLLGTGFWLTIRLRGIQFRALFYALRLTFSKEREGEGDISHFASLMTALAATVGIGNIAGLQSALDAKAATLHNHAGIYEPVITKLTAFNKNFGTGNNDVPWGDHTHSQYALQTSVDNINTLLASDELTLDTLQEIVDFIELNKAELDTLGIGNIAGLQNALDAKAAALHNHDGIYEPVITKLTAFNKNFGTGNGDVPRGDHTHTGTYEGTFVKNTAFNKDKIANHNDIAPGASLADVILNFNTMKNKMITAEHMAD